MLFQAMVEDYVVEAVMEAMLGRFGFHGHSIPIPVGEFDVTSCVCEHSGSLHLCQTNHQGSIDSSPASFWALLRASPAMQFNLHPYHITVSIYLGY